MTLEQILDDTYNKATSLGIALPNILGFMRRVQGSMFYREPPKGVDVRPPTLAEMQHAIFTVSTEIRKAGMKKV